MGTRFFPRYNQNLITSRFGMRTLRGQTKMHNGIDMTATNDGEVGTTDYILAHTGGTVDSVGYNSSAGNYVRIRVDSKTIMAYYHLKNPCVLKKGASVKKGDKLGGMRVIPLVIEKEKMEEAVRVAGSGPLFRLEPFRKKKFGLVTTGNEVFHHRIEDTFSPVIIS